MEGVRQFSIWDYVVFGVMLLLSITIGIYSAFSGGRQQTADEVLLGNRRLNPIAVGLSIMSSTVSAIAIIGTPGEVYMYDTMFAWIIVSYIPANILIATLLIPVYFNFNFTSIYQFLEMRFNRAMRLFGTIVFIISTGVYMGIAIYTPAIAINAVTGMSTWACVVITGVVGTFYTTVGGMKAVVWSDTLQSCIMIIGVVAVIIKGTIEVGGIDNVWRVGVEGKRVEFLKTSPDPTIVYSVWTVMIGLGCLNFNAGVGQMQVQRLISCGTRKRATLALFVSMFAYMIIIALCVMSGVVMYTYYIGCDPITSGSVKSGDQIMPLLVMDLFGSLPGIPGLFLSAVVAASLSTLSSGINALAAVTGEDIVKTILPGIKPLSYTRTIKGLVLFYGMLSLGFAFLADLLGQGILQQSLSLAGLTAGAILGVFLLGIYFHRCTNVGAFVGLFSSLFFVGWLKLGSMLYPSSRGKNPLSIDECLPHNDSIATLLNQSIWTTTPLTYHSLSSTISPETSSFSVVDLYHISFLYYTPIGLIIAVIVGITVSAITGFRDPSTVDPRLRLNLTDALFCCLSEPLKTKRRCGAEKSDLQQEEQMISGDGVNESKDIPLHNYAYRSDISDGSVTRVTDP